MSLALNLARSRFGLTGINPSVGCVIVKNDEIISIGRTGINGKPHAETQAINSSYQNVVNSKMYVTLEPCNHYGKTPPCTNLIIKKKIKEVFFSINDIDKNVKGKTLKLLKSKKILVKKGLLKNEVNDFYKSYFFNRNKKIPYVTGKIAVSNNNLIYSKNKKKITDKYSDQITHNLRYKNDSLLITYKTLNVDNPKLNCRLKGLSKFSPIRIVLDNNLNMDTKSYIFKTATKKNTIIFYNQAKNSKINFFKKKGIKLIKSKLDSSKYFNLNIILKKLYKNGCRNLLVEGGDKLSSSFFKKKLFNQFYLYKSQKNLPKIVNYKVFNSFINLSQNYKNKLKIKTKLGKDTIFFYRR